MSYSNRDKAQRKLRQSENSIDTALLYIAQVSEAYKEPEPKISVQLELCAHALMTAQEMVEQVRKSF